MQMQRGTKAGSPQLQIDHQALAPCFTRAQADQLLVRP